MTAVDPPRLPREVPDWHESAACRLFPELDWIDAKGPAALACRAVCAACPVRLACATSALERGEPWGIHGGLDRKDRTALAAEHGYPRPAVLPDHGTNARYAKHECRCPECRSAHAIYEFDRRAKARTAAKARDLWRSPIAVDRPIRYGRRPVAVGQLLLPLAIPPPRWASIGGADDVVPVLTLAA